MKKLWLLMLLALVISVVPLTHLQGQAIPPSVDQQKVMAAIAKGSNYLLSFTPYYSNYPSIWPGQQVVSADELILFTLIHVGADQNSDGFKQLLARVLQNSNKQTKTYRVALLAMALEALDGEKYQSKIAQCAQFLVNYQCRNGQWDYPGKMGPELVQTGTTPEDKPATETSTRAINILEIEKEKIKGVASIGDNSNTQYALLGLRACKEAHIEIPKATFQKAATWLGKSQNSDGGWGYYREERDHSYGSMTAGGLGALVICQYYLGKDYKKHTGVRKALKWLENNFSVTSHPGGGSLMWHYYYLYALERAGLLYGTETFGEHEWYKEGAEYLLKAQKPNGSWWPYGTTQGKALCTDAVETCFALLFLRRATKPIISK